MTQIYISEIFFLVLIGFGTGILSGMTAIGGGVVIVPVLAEALGFDIVYAIATSLFTIIFTSSSTVYGHYRNSNLYPKASAILAPFGIIFSIIGSKVAIVTNASILKFFFSVIVIAIAGRMLYDQWVLKHQNDHVKTAVNMGVKGTVHTVNKYKGIVLLSLVGICGGFLSGLLGIGGAVVMVPFLVVFVGIPVKKAVGIAAPIVLINAIAGSMSYIMAGRVLFLYAFAIVFGTIPGAQIGTRIHQKVDNRIVSVIIVIIMGIIALTMLHSASIAS